MGLSVNADKHHHSWFETCFITILTLLAVKGAFIGIHTLLLPLSHASLLISLYLLVSSLCGRMHTYLGRFVFAAATLLLSAELIAQHFLGLHVNLFLLKNIIQPGAEQHIGFSLSFAASLCGLVFITAWFGSAYLSRYRFQLKARYVLVLALAALCASQTTYAVAYYKGNPDIMIVKRQLPYFTAPHPYHIRRFLAPMLGERDKNPFALDRPMTQEAPLQGGYSFEKGPDTKNLLLIVMDSLRSQDIAQNPALAPNMIKWGKKGRLSLQHYSVSNCTHFSFYSLLTGKLPLSYGEARRRGYAPSILHQLARAGWQVSSSEAQSLDWYDAAKLLIPERAERRIAPHDAESADAFVLRDTLDQITGYADSNAPFAHMAYFYGSHFPYTEDQSSIAATTDIETNKAHYLASITAFDARLDTLLTALETSGTLDDTLVIITSDHGESFMEDGMLAHSSDTISLYQLQVPFLVLGAQKTSILPVSHQGIAPFILKEITGNPSTNPQTGPTILTSCGYEYPSAFAVLKGGTISHFIYEDGYLHAGKHTIDTGDEAEAAAILLKALSQ